MKTIAVFAMAHPVLALIGVWAANAVVRQAISGATGYDTLAVVVDGLKASGRVDRAKAKVTT